MTKPRITKKWSGWSVWDYDACEYWTGLALAEAFETAAAITASRTASEHSAGVRGLESARPATPDDQARARSIARG